MNDETEIIPLGNRFRGFLPVVIDVETGGFDYKKDALLELAAVTLRMDEKGNLLRHQVHSWHIEPFPNANMDPKSLEINGIKPFSPFRMAVPEDKAINEFFKIIRREVKTNRCSRAVLVGHNAPFDLNFLNATSERIGCKRNPFHPFSTLDTVTLGAVVYGQTVLARVAQAAGLGWDSAQAHSAVYDVEKTADIFCHVVNTWQSFQPVFTERES